MLIVSAQASLLPFQFPVHSLVTSPGRDFSIWQQRLSSKLLMGSRIIQNHPILKSGPCIGAFAVRALKDDRQGSRLVAVVRTIPALANEYFKSPFRRSLFGGISLFGGFYVAQTISLSFGALGVNDVIAAVLCVLFTEYVTRFYHTRKRPIFAVALLNNFKMGFSYGLFIDAFKLAS